MGDNTHKKMKDGRVVDSTLLPIQIGCIVLVCMAITNGIVDALPKPTAGYIVTIQPFLYYLIVKNKLNSNIDNYNDSLSFYKAIFGDMPLYLYSALRRIILSPIIIIFSISVFYMSLLVAKDVCLNSNECLIINSIKYFHIAIFFIILLQSLMAVVITVLHKMVIGFKPTTTILFFMSIMYLLLILVAFYWATIGFWDTFVMVEVYFKYGHV